MERKRRQKVRREIVCVCEREVGRERERVIEIKREQRKYHQRSQSTPVNTVVYCVQTSLDMYLNRKLLLF